MFPVFMVVSVQLKVWSCGSLTLCSLTPAGGGGRSRGGRDPAEGGPGVKQAAGESTGGGRAWEAGAARPEEQSCRERGEKCKKMTGTRPIVSLRSVKDNQGHQSPQILDRLLLYPLLNTFTLSKPRRRGTRTRRSVSKWNLYLIQNLSSILLHRCVQLLNILTLDTLSAVYLCYFSLLVYFILYSVYNVYVNIFLSICSI